MSAFSEKTLWEWILHVKLTEYENDNVSDQEIAKNIFSKNKK